MLTESQEVTVRIQLTQGCITQDWSVGYQYTVQKGVRYVSKILNACLLGNKQLAG